MTTPLTVNDFATDQEVRWCPGCGDFSILAQLKQVLAAQGVPPREGRLRFRHRLCRENSLLPEHVRIPHDPWPSPRGGDRPQAGDSRTCRSGSFPATATRLPGAGGNHLLRRSRLPQRRHQDPDVQQRGLRPHEGPAFADRPHRHPDPLQPRTAASRRRSGRCRWPSPPARRLSSPAPSTWTSAI